MNTIEKKGVEISIRKDRTGSIFINIIAQLM